MHACPSLDHWGIYRHRTYGIREGHVQCHVHTSMWIYVSTCDHTHKRNGARWESSDLREIELGCFSAKQGQTFRESIYTFSQIKTQSCSVCSCMVVGYYLIGCVTKSAPQSVKDSKLKKLAASLQLINQMKARASLRASSRTYACKSTRPSCLQDASCMLCSLEKFLHFTVDRWLFH
jgi:hypothetical protein